MRVWLTNWIADYSDSKLADFDRRFRFVSKSNNESESTIVILIWFRYKIDLFRYKIHLLRCKTNLFQYKIDLFGIKDWKRPSKCRLINRKSWNILKMTNYIKNNNQNDHFRSNSTNFWYKLNFFRYKSNYFQYKWSGFESSWWFQSILSTISDQISWLKADSKSHLERI